MKLLRAEGAPFSPSMEEERENNLPLHSLIHTVNVVIYYYALNKSHIHCVFE
jgi:hypothetical protein